MATKRAATSRQTSLRDLRPEAPSAAAKRLRLSHSRGVTCESEHVLLGRASFFSRLRSFGRNPTQWRHSHPLSPLEAALHGFELVSSGDDHILRCVSCGRMIYAKLPSHTVSRDTFERALDALKARLISKHKDGCIFRTCQAPSSFAVVDVDVYTLEFFENSVFKMVEGAGIDLPRLRVRDYSDFVDLHLLDKIVDAIVAKREEQDLNLEVVKSAVVLTLFGWGLVNNRSLKCLDCNFCGRRWGLWNLVNLEDEYVDEEEQQRLRLEREDIAQQLIDQVIYRVVQDGHRKSQKGVEHVGTNGFGHNQDTLQQQAYDDQQVDRNEQIAIAEQVDSSEEAGIDEQAESNDQVTSNTVPSIGQVGSNEQADIDEQEAKNEQFDKPPLAVQQEEDASFGDNEDGPGVEERQPLEQNALEMRQDKAMSTEVPSADQVLIAEAQESKHSITLQFSAEIQQTGDIAERGQVDQMPKEHKVVQVTESISQTVHIQEDDDGQSQVEIREECHVALVADDDEVEVATDQEEVDIVQEEDQEEATMVTDEEGDVGETEEEEETEDVEEGEEEGIEEEGEDIEEEQEEGEEEEAEDIEEEQEEGEEEKAEDIEEEQEEGEEEEIAQNIYEENENDEADIIEEEDDEKANQNVEEEQEDDVAEEEDDSNEIVEEEVESEEEANSENEDEVDIGSESEDEEYHTCMESFFVGREDSQEQGEPEVHNLTATTASDEVIILSSDDEEEDEVRETSRQVLDSVIVDVEGKMDPNLNVDGTVELPPKTLFNPLHHTSWCPWGRGANNNASTVTSLQQRLVSLYGLGEQKQSRDNRLRQALQTLRGAN